VLLQICKNNGFLVFFSWLTGSWEIEVHHRRKNIFQFDLNESKSFDSPPNKKYHFYLKDSLQVSLLICKNHGLKKCIPELGRVPELLINSEKASTHHVFDEYIGRFSRFSMIYIHDPELLYLKKAVVRLSEADIMLPKRN
jgi:hypothetical protein